MGRYDTMQVCLNGHQITDSYTQFPEDRKKHCDDCGAKTIHLCPKCKEPIKGHYISEGYLGSGPVDVPKHCHSCGEPYPWAKQPEESQEEVIEEQNNPLDVVEHICGRFHLVARQLRNRHDNRSTLEISDEYDVQDLLHVLLRIHFDDIRPEEWTPSYAGGSSRKDFLLWNERIVVEVKKTRTGLGAKEVGEELIIDIAKYRQHQHCKTLLCFVYDPEDKISNPQAIENDLTEISDEFSVKVIIVPKGY